MSEALYLNDAYLREFDAVVKSVSGEGKFVVLDRTAFYPRSGGQENDTGVLRRGDDVFNVVYVGKFNGEISHQVESPPGKSLREGDKVRGVIKWERRYRLMRMHTAAHLLSAVFYRNTGAKITGNQLGEDKSRIDFSLENFDREALNEYVKEANRIIKEDIRVEISFMPREEALKMEGIVKLANALPPAIKTLRIVKIGDVDMQADGGTHVSSTAEIGEIVLLKAENKGKNNRRVYYTLK